MVCHWSLYISGLVVLCAISTVYSQQDATAVLCNRAEDCIACMEAHPQCNWCIAKPSNSSKSGWSETEKRCNTYSNLVNRGCPANSITNITTEKTSVQDDKVRDASDDGTYSAIQLSPQKVSLKLRPNEKVTIPLTFRLAKDYPVDLYYLMDLSQSMADDKEKVAKLGISLADEMREITKDVRLGFGSFVDKVLMPYVNTLEERLKSPCTGCESPYSFKHRLSLTANTAIFGVRVNATSISGNLDEPEGGFDALMQAIVCKDFIGWREHSRKMLIFSTDASFHSAGDGKIGGVLEPNDGACHMNQNNEYTYAEKQDYPSISQLASKIAHNRMNVIFAVTEKQVDRYMALSEIIPGSVAGKLANDSSNIVQLVRENYEKISSTVSMTIRSGDEKNENLKVKIRSACNGGEFADAASCDGLNPGGTVNFEVEVQATCAGQGSYTEQFEVYPLGLSESLTVTAQVDCECTCDDTEPNSPVCSGFGTYECGMCECDDSHYGDSCQCDISNVGKDGGADYYAPCIPPANSSLVQLPCTERGECLCGKCEKCSCLLGTSGDNCKRYFGKYCQCNPDFCKCSGHGTCQCNDDSSVPHCLCDEGYTGTDCNCLISNATCYDEDGVLCSNRGECVCGKCECSTIGNERYFGPLCQECSTCSSSKCVEYTDCVKCVAHEKGIWQYDAYDEQICMDYCNDTANSNANFKVVSKMFEGPEIKECLGYIKGADDCKVNFVYEYEPKILGYNVYISEEKECVSKPNYLAIILGVVGGIVFLGIVALLIWKLVTTVHDRREFSKFEKDRQNAQWIQTENPIYVKGTSTFKNPMYKGNQN